MPMNIDGMRRVPKFAHEDPRGRFEKYFSHGELDSSDNLVWKESFSTTSVYGTVRGMHLQIPPFENTRLISCSEGQVRDVCVDLRVGSPTFHKVHVEEMDQGSEHSILVPPGVAHGFAVIRGPARLLYFSTAPYSPRHDVGVLWSSIGIKWPVGQPIVSTRDQGLPRLEDFVSPFSFEW